MTLPLSLVPFRPEHAEALVLRPPAARLLARLPPLAELARSYAAAGPAWTLMAGAAPLACGGAVRFWPGVGELWCWTGQEAGRWAVGFARLARHAVSGLLGPGGFHRLQAHVRSDDLQGRGFALFLGLASEGRCPGYGPDQSDYHLYGRFAPWNR